MQGEPWQSQTLQQESGFRLERIDGELVLYSPNSEAMASCNETAALVWALCNGERNLAQVVELVAEAYPASGSVEGDIRATAEQLRDAGILRKVEVGG